jgi:phosphoribosylaminoimidazole (AIR) synthetase
MFRIFNCGIGMVLIVSEEDSGAVLDEINNHNFKCFNIGTLINKESNNSVIFE